MTKVAKAKAKHSLLSRFLHVAHLQYQAARLRSDKFMQFILDSLPAAGLQYSHCHLGCVAVVYLPASLPIMFNLEVAISGTGRTSCLLAHLLHLAGICVTVFKAKPF